MSMEPILQKKRILIFIMVLILVSCGRVPSPAPYGVLPSERQLNWHQLEYYAFIHFNMNTFTDMEWGMGEEKPEWFNPTELDAEQWVRVIKEAGMKGVILTAKHHDGFCLWPSKYTEHSVKNSPWRGGKGDVVKELADACKKYGIKFGVYLSPWDRNHPEYGREAYVTYFHNQLRELLTNYGEIFEVWFDGANGGTGYYGGANERRNIDAETYYQWDKVKEIVRELQPQAVIFGDGEMDVRWVGNEEGVGGEVSWAPININDLPDGMTKRQHLSRGDENGKCWIPAEVDVSIRPGWYYHKREDHQVKSLQHLVEIYYNSVGRNASLLLNFPVDTRGLIHEKDVEQVMKLKETLDKDFQTELAHNAKATASSVRKGAKHFAAQKAIDKNPETFWSPDEVQQTSNLTIAFDKPTVFNRVVMQEYIRLGQRVKNYEIQILQGESWQKIHEGETIGYKTIVRFNPVETKALRLVFNQSLAVPLIANVEVYKAPALLVSPELYRNKDGQVSFMVPEENIAVFYTLDGTEPSIHSLRYTKPFQVEKPLQIKAVAYDSASQRYSEVLTKKLDISKKDWKILEVSSGNIQKAIALIDEDPISEFYTAQSGKKQFVTIDLAKEHTLKGFSYLPPQARWAYGTVSHYEFYISSDAKKWNLVSQGEFSNVKNNPILQEIEFTPVKARYVKFVALEQTDTSNAAGFSEIGIITQEAL